MRPGARDQRSDRTSDRDRVGGRDRFRGKDRFGGTDRIGSRDRPSGRDRGGDQGNRGQRGAGQRRRPEAREEAPDARGVRAGDGPPLPEDLDPRSLDAEVRGQLRPLARGVAEQVSLRLLATGELIDVDPETALAHALVARRLASRIPAVREAVGLAAYHAGQWQSAIGELRAYHRMTGRQSHLAMLADCERALGRSERAIDLYRGADRNQMSRDEAAELLIVAAGARADLGQRDAALAMLQVPELRADEPWVARLRYAYADALLGVGRRDDAREWFARAAEVDEDAATDAAERLLELDGVVLDDGDVDDDLDGGELEDEDTPASKPHELDDLGLEDLPLDNVEPDDLEPDDLEPDDLEPDDRQRGDVERGDLEGAEKTDDDESGPPRS